MFLLRAFLFCGAAIAAVFQPYGEDVFAWARRAGAPVVLYFDAEDCADCRGRAAVLRGILEERPFRSLILLRADMDVHGRLAARLGIQKPDTMIAFLGDAEVARLWNASEDRKIRSFLGAAVSGRAYGRLEPRPPRRVEPFP